MTKDKFYIYPYVGWGRAAIAVEVFPELRVAGVGVAWCSPKDQFNRKKGRMIAEGRLQRGGNAYYEIPLSSEATRRDIIEAVVATMTYADAPRWAVKAFKYA